ncbi:hypothetical protein DIPPA_31498 [Diplonema papillatum]|nr:hypothetical protein DIPPA_31498 [Diplonema papillatum]
MQEAYRTFERGTPAGDALYRLYNGKKKMDSTLDRGLLTRLQEMRKRQAEIEQPRVRPTPKARAHVSVPRPTGKRPTASDTFACGRVAAPCNGKRLQPVLQHVLKARQLEVEGQAAPEKRYIGEGEKDRLAHLMHTGEDTSVLAAQPPASPPTTLEGRRIKRQTEAIRKMKKDFEALDVELREKQAALSTLLAMAARPRKAEASLRSDLTNVVTDMRQLDRLIKDEEALLQNMLDR